MTHEVASVFRYYDRKTVSRSLVSFPTDHETYLVRIKNPAETIEDPTEGKVVFDGVEHEVVNGPLLSVLYGIRWVYGGNFGRVSAGHMFFLKRPKSSNPFDIQVVTTTEPEDFKRLIAEIKAGSPRLVKTADPLTGEGMQEAREKSLLALKRIKVDTTFAIDHRSW